MQNEMQTKTFSLIPLTYFSPLIQPSPENWNRGENGLDFYLSYLQTLQKILLEIPSCPKKDIFVTEFVTWGNFMKQGK